jgi:type I restriction enzyme S subunit
MSKQAKKGLVPMLRFPEFRDTGEWDKKNLGELAIFLKGKGLPKSAITRNGKNLCVHYGELFTEYSEVIANINSRTDLYDGCFFSFENDVLMPTSDVTPNGLAKACCIKFDGVILGGDILVIRTDKTVINGEFISRQIRHLEQKVLQLVSGSTVFHLYASSIEKLALRIPSFKEQQKIADCLSSIDELVTAQTQKLEALKAHKKGLMQQLFPAEGETVPKLRFPEFRGAGEWKIKPLDKLFTIGNGKDYKHLSTGDIPVYGSGGYMLSVNDYLYDGESVCIGRKGTINNPMFLTGKFWTVDTLFYTHSFKACSPKFIYLIFQNINWLTHNEAGGVPSLSKANISKIEVAVPEPDEQQKIADCLSSIDDLITAQTQKLATLKAHKKGLMQQLFPAVDLVTE